MGITASPLIGPLGLALSILVASSLAFYYVHHQHTPWTLDLKNLEGQVYHISLGTK